MVKEHLCTVAVDVAMGEEHADGESRLNVIGQIQEGLVSIPSMSILQLVFLFGLLWLVMRSYNPPPSPSTQEGVSNDLLPQVWAL